MRGAGLKRRCFQDAAAILRVTLSKYHKSKKAAFQFSTHRRIHYRLHFISNLSQRVAFVINLPRK